MLQQPPKKVTAQALDVAADVIMLPRPCKVTAQALDVAADVIMLPRPCKVTAQALAVAADVIMLPRPSPSASAEPWRERDELRKIGCNGCKIP